MASFNALNAYVLTGTEPNFTIGSLYNTGGYSCVDTDGSDGTFESGDVITINGPDISESEYSYVGFFENGWIGNQFGFKLLLTNSTYDVGDPITSDPDTFPVCFLAATRIATPSGERPVEDLAIGDPVLGADGVARPVRWIGRQSLVTVFADPQRSFPIRIAAGALGENTPSRDLFVSPQHALLVDGLLVQAGALVDGGAIRREPSAGERFTWFHIELADHALVLAEGAPAETFVDNVSRRRFDNYAEYEALHGADASAIPELPLPRAKSARQLPAAVRARLDARAVAIGAVARAA